MGAVAIPGRICISGAVFHGRLCIDARARPPTQCRSRTGRVDEPPCGVAFTGLWGVRAEFNRRIDVPDAGTESEIPQTEGNFLADAFDSAARSDRWPVALRWICSFDCWFGNRRIRNGSAR